MIDHEACQKGGSMRSKSVAERPDRESQAAARTGVARPLHSPGALSLVRGTETGPAGKMKPGLY